MHYHDYKEGRRAGCTKKKRTRRLKKEKDKSTVDPILFTQNFEQLPRTKKIWKNMKNHGMVCPPPQNQKGDKNPASESYHNHLPPFFEDFGGVSTSNVPSYEWSS